MSNALKRCARCGILIPWGKQYCDTCKPIAAAELENKRQTNRAAASSKYNKNRRKEKYIEFYRSKEWRTLSKGKLSSVNYKCEECGGIAVEVHHIKPIQTPEGWELRFDCNNLKALCTSCHNKNHNRSGYNTHGIIDVKAVERGIRGGGG